MYGIRIHVYCVCITIPASKNYELLRKTPSNSNTFQWTVCWNFSITTTWPYSNSAFWFMQWMLGYITVSMNGVYRCYIPIACVGPLALMADSYISTVSIDLLQKIQIRYRTEVNRSVIGIIYRSSSAQNGFRWRLAIQECKMQLPFFSISIVNYIPIFYRNKLVVNTTKTKYIISNLNAQKTIVFFCRTDGSENNISTSCCLLFGLQLTYLHRQNA